MAKTSKKWISERKVRIEEYERVRGILWMIITASETNTTDRVEAVKILYRIDSEGVPMPESW